MIWLTWRQSRAALAMMSTALAALAVILGVTGSGVADEYSTGIAACATEGGCSQFVQQFFNGHQAAFLALTAVVLVLPALIGIFWGAPLIARELEAGTHRLVWTQSITRTRWLAVKLGLTGLAAMVAAGLGSLAVTWWSGPVDKSAPNFARMEPLLFDARGIAPIGYAAFAFALGVTVGMLVRRTVPAMAITLVVFVAVQVAMPLLVRAHLSPATRSTIEITKSNLEHIGFPRDGGPTRILTRAPDSGVFAGAWVLSSQTIDASGDAVDAILLPRSGACAPPEGGLVQKVAGARPEFSACLAEIKRLGYRQRVSYHPASRFWAFQAYEAAIFTGLALLLTAFSFLWLRRRLS